MSKKFVSSFSASDYNILRHMQKTPQNQRFLPKKLQKNYKKMIDIAEKK